MNKQFSTSDKQITDRSRSSGVTPEVQAKLSTLIAKGVQHAIEAGRHINIDRLLGGNPTPDERELLTLLEESALTLAKESDGRQWRAVSKFIRKNYAQKFQTK